MFASVGGRGIVISRRPRHEHPHGRVGDLVDAISAVQCGMHCRTDGKQEER
jgi:hypothetical protein